MTIKWPDKDPNEVLDYDLDWSLRLAGDTIATSVWSVVDGSVTISSSSNSGAVAKVWLTGGSDGDICDILDRITTTGGRTMDQTVRLRIKTR